MNGEILEAAIKEDKDRGLIPFCCVATLGTTSSCAFDDLKSLGQVCQAQVNHSRKIMYIKSMVLRVYGST